MSLHENSLAQLIERICRVHLKGQDGLPAWRGGTATGGTTGTLVDTARRETDDYFQSIVPVPKVHIISTTDGQAPVGEERDITDWVLSTWTATVLPIFTVAPAAGDTYSILIGYEWDEIKAAINTAIDFCSNRMVIDKVDETLELQSDTYEYALPSGFTHLYRITMADANGFYYDSVIPPDQYKIIIATSTPRLHFYSFPREMQYDGHYYSQLWGENSIADGRKVRIEGFQKQPRLDSDQDICYLDPVFICWQAAAYLHASRIQGNDTDARKQQFDLSQMLALQSFRPTSFPPNTKRVGR